MLLDPQEDLGAVGADRPDDLWRWLVQAHTLRADPNSWLAEVAFRHMHRENPEDAATPAHGFAAVGPPSDVR